jgi:hypothetical protein
MSETYHQAKRQELLGPNLFSSPSTRLWRLSLLDCRTLYSASSVKGSAFVYSRTTRRGTLLVSAKAKVLPLKAFLVILLLCVSGCSWFHRKPHAPDPTELIVTGAPVGSTVFVDGVQAGQAKEVANRPQEVEVTPGAHILEVRMGDTVAYRENTYVTPGEKRVITVLSGTGRN